MKGVKAEVTIDLDDKRRVWISMSAETIEGESELIKLAQAAANAGLTAYLKAGGKSPQDAAQRLTGGGKANIAGFGEVGVSPADGGG